MIAPTPGSRVQLHFQPNEPDPLPRGATGTVRSVNDLSFMERGAWQAHVEWDPPNSHRTIMLLNDDHFSLLSRAGEEAQA